MDLQHSADWILKNVRLEVGFEYDDKEEVSATKTALFTLHIKEGKIAEINPYHPTDEGVDAQSNLLLPSFKDMHTHLDKHFFGLPWRAKRPEHQTVQDMITYEQKIIPELFKTTKTRTQQLVTKMQEFGTDFARSHVNIDSTSKLKSLELLQETLISCSDSFSAEIVAFPQHGLFYTPSTDYMKEAAALEIVDYIGGLDPTSIDGSLEKSVDFTVQLATDYHKGIDIHLHEMGASGVQTLEYLVKKVEENPELKGKTFVSHAYVLGVLPQKELKEIALKLAHAQIGIITTFPFTDFKIPYLELLKYGVEVHTGTDNIVDHWSTFGSVNLLEKANLAAQLYHLESEFELSRTLKLATNNLTPLDDKGRQVWPKTQDKADFVLMDAGCSAEAVSRLKPVKMLVHKGMIVNQTLS